MYVYPSPSLKELEDFYTRSDKGSLSQVCWTTSTQSHKHVWPVWQQALDTIEALSGRGPLLDVGCGTGPFLTFAEEHGWDNLTGIEMVPSVADTARKNSTAQIHTTDLLNAALPANSYVGIILWDIVEHLNNIRVVLAEAHRLLRNGGVIFIGTVHRQGLSMRLLQEKALTVNPPEHLVFFTQAGMGRVLELAGFDVKHQWSFSIYLREWLRFFYRFQRQTPAVESNNTGSNVSGSSPFTGMMALANCFLKTTNLGDEPVAIGQKPFP